VVALAWIPLTVVLGLSAFVLYMSFVPELPTDFTYTLANWQRLFTPFVLTQVLPNTAIVGVGSVLVALVVGFPLAWLLERTTMPLQRLVVIGMAMSIIVPGFILAMGWLMLVNPRIGILNKLLEGALGQPQIALELTNPFGVAFVQGLALASTVFFSIAGVMRRMDPSLEEAATTCGAGWHRVILRVNFPLLWPATLGAAIYVFMTAISIFEIPAVLGAGTGRNAVLATELFYSAQPPSAFGGVPRYGAAGVYGAAITLPSLAALYFYYRVLREAHRYAIVRGKDYRPRRFDLGRWTYLGVAFVLAYLLLAIVLPLLALVWLSLLPNMRPPSPEALGLLSFERYARLPSFIGASVLTNTALLVIGVAALVTTFSVLVSWVVVRTRVRVRHLMDVLAMLPHAVPGLGFAFALLMIAILASRWIPWLPLSGTLGIIILAHALNRLAYGTRLTNAAMLQVSPELEESAYVCGGSVGNTLRHVLVPIIQPSLMFAALWTALLSFREVTMALMLTGPGNRVAAVAVWRLWESGDLSTAAAGALAMVFVGGIIAAAALAISGGDSQHQLGR
jgi:iron(III) transport system permease protein